MLHKHFVCDQVWSVSIPANQPHPRYLNILTRSIGLHHAVTVEKYWNRAETELLSEMRTQFLKAVIHFKRIVAKRSVFHCFVNTQAELVIWTQ